MADVQVFFNRPLIPIDQTQLCDDLRAATYRAAIASAWFTDTAIAEAFIASPASHKVAVFNQHDLARGSRKAVSMVQEHIANIVNDEKKVHKARAKKLFEIYPTWQKEIKTLSVDEFSTKLTLAGEDVDKAIPLDRTGAMGVIGSKDWQNGIMHHKFIVADDVVWFGSFNFTYNAKNNYETLARVEDENTATLFWVEVQCMAEDENAWNENNENGAHGSFLAKCSVCQKMFPANQVGYIDSHGVTCPECSKRTEH